MVRDFCTDGKMNRNQRMENARVVEEQAQEKDEPPVVMRFFMLLSVALILPHYGHK